MVLKRVKKYLTSHGVRKGLMFDPEARHGQSLIVGGSAMSNVMKWLKEPITPIPPREPKESN